MLVLGLTSGKVDIGQCVKLGHHDVDVVATDVNPNYKTAVEDLVKTVLDRLTE